MTDVRDSPPLPPPVPDSADCCGEGCANCIFDIYERALARYEARLAQWQTMQGAPRAPTDAI